MRTAIQGSLADWNSNNQGQTLRYPRKSAWTANRHGLGSPAFSRLRAPGARCPRRAICGAAAGRLPMPRRWGVTAFVPLCQPGRRRRGIEPRRRRAGWKAGDPSQPRRRRAGWKAGGPSQPRRRRAGWKAGDPSQPRRRRAGWKAGGPSQPRRRRAGWKAGGPSQPRRRRAGWKAGDPSQPRRRRAGWKAGDPSQPRRASGHDFRPDQNAARAAPSPAKRSRSQRPTPLIS
jgi:hypothetical protein